MRIATLCSHSALQIFLGAREEGFESVGVCPKERVRFYLSFPRAKPDHLIEIKEWGEIENREIAEKLNQLDSVLIPHGTLIKVLGERVEKLEVPIFGSREALVWENNRKKQREWMEEAGLKFPREGKELRDDDLVFVKFHGARGGAGYFISRKKDVKGVEGEIQEFIPGVRYYFHFFFSRVRNRLEILGIDKRIETIDEIYRALGADIEEFRDYTVSGNLPLVLRESLLVEVMEMGERVVEAAEKFGGLWGPFCLETVYSPSRGFVVFEISARIVAGTTVFIPSPPYSRFYFNEEMYMGRRIARELKEAERRRMLEKVLS